MPCCAFDRGRWGPFPGEQLKPPTVNADARSSDASKPRFTGLQENSTDKTHLTVPFAHTVSIDVRTKSVVWVGPSG